MALQGNIKDFSITQLLNLINLARKTGVLMVRNSQESARLTFREGKLILAETNTESPALPIVLLKGGKLTRQQSAALTARANKVNDQEMALLLTNGGYLSQQDIADCFRKHGQSIIGHLFNWSEGQFEFLPNLTPPSGKVLVPIELEGIIMEGSRRIRELERLKQEIPDIHNFALRFIERPDSRLRGVNLSVEEWKVVSFVNPRNSINQIARANNMDDAQIRRIVYSLIQAGLVQIVPLVTANAANGKQPIKPKEREEKRSLVTRLIERIRSL